jgi:hypothetical protein
MKTGLIAMAVIAVTAAAGVGGYKLMNRAEERPHVAPQNTYSATTNANSYQPTPETRSTSSFSTFGFGSPNKNTAVAPVKKAKHGKHIAKHSKKHHGKKHFAKHSKKHHGKKHFAKHSKKHGKHYAKHAKKHGKHYAKHHKKKKKHASEATASR